MHKEYHLSWLNWISLCSTRMPDKVLCSVDVDCRESNPPWVPQGAGWQVAADRGRSVMMWAVKVCTTHICGKSDLERATKGTLYLFWESSIKPWKLSVSRELELQIHCLISKLHVQFCYLLIPGLLIHTINSWKRMKFCKLIIRIWRLYWTVPSWDKHNWKLTSLNSERSTNCWILNVQK